MPHRSMLRIVARVYDPLGNSTILFNGFFVWVSPKDFYKVFQHYLPSQAKNYTASWHIYELVFSCVEFSIRVLAKYKKEAYTPPFVMRLDCSILITSSFWI